MPVVHFYSRRGCHLCEVMLEELLPLLRDKAQLEIRDVDTSVEWFDRFNLRVPVLEANGQLISEYPLDYRALADYLRSLAGRGGDTGA